MHYVKQDYFDEFVCIADKCPKSCCEGWQIVIDEDSLESYDNMQGAIGNRIKNSIDWEEGTFLQYGKRCAMLNERGLCDLQLSQGEAALCYTCRQYPRHIEDYEDVREYSLSLSCPEVARLTALRDGHMSYLEWDTDEIDDFEEFDDLMYDRLCYCREMIYSVIRNNSYSLMHRLNNLLLLGKTLQESIDNDKILELDAIVDSWDIDNTYQDSYNEALTDFEILYSLEHLDDSWVEALDNVKRNVLSSNETYQSFCREVEAASFQKAGEHILESLVYTYFSGAVYDDMVYSKLALVVYSVKWIFMLAVSRLDSMNAIDAICEMTWKYAREIEHSDINLDELELIFNDKY